MEKLQPVALGVVRFFHTRSRYVVSVFLEKSSDRLTASVWSFRFLLLFRTSCKAALSATVPRGAGVPHRDRVQVSQDIRSLSNNVVPRFAREGFLAWPETAAKSAIENNGTQCSTHPRRPLPAACSPQVPTKSTHNSYRLLATHLLVLVLRHTKCCAMLLDVSSAAVTNRGATSGAAPGSCARPRRQ
jgi:hypothetical protein